MDWRPIETAPKDGSVILIYEGDWDNPLRRIGVAYWSQRENIFVGADFKHPYASHWMPLPNPPKSE